MAINNNMNFRGSEITNRRLSNIGNERRTIQNGNNRIFGRMGNHFQNMKTDSLPEAVKIDGSLREIMEMKQQFLRELTNDEKSKTFEQLHSEILENYSGKERDKRVAALNTARQITEKRGTAAFNPFEAFSNFEERKAWLEQVLLEQAAKDNHWESMRNERGGRHYLDPNMCQITMNSFGNGLILEFSGMLFFEMMDNGIESSMALFEKIRTDLVENFAGSEDELKARLEALERGFLRATDQFTHMVVGSLMVSSPHYTPEDGSTTLTARQAAANVRIQRGADNITAHIGAMFRSALAFFNATGSFAGFFDTAEANQPGMLSMRDVEIISRQTFNNSSGTSHTDRISAPGLSSSGRAYLQRFFQIA